MLWLAGYGLLSNRSGVWLGVVDNARSVPAVTVKNCADLISRLGANCQSLASKRSIRPENLGVVATMLNWNVCRISRPRQLLRQARRLPGIEFPLPAVGFWNH